MQKLNYFTDFLRAKKATPRAAVSVAKRATNGVLSPVVVVPVDELLDEELFDEELFDEAELFDEELFDEELFDEELELLSDEEVLELTCTPSLSATSFLIVSQSLPVAARPSSFQLNIPASAFVSLLTS